MKKKAKRPRRNEDRDTMLAEYDFTGGVRGATAARYDGGVNIVVIDPDVRDIFPDSQSVNQLLRALAPVVRGRRRASRRRRTA